MIGRRLQLFGRAVPYGPWSKPDAFGDRFRVTKGAYVPAAPTLAHYSHDKQTVIGTTENNSLRFSEDDLGLNVEIDLPRTAEARKTFNLVDEDYVTGMSFGMKVIDARKVGFANGVTDYEVTKFTLTEVSPTAKPSFTGTSISTKPGIRDGRDEIVRAAQAAIDAERRKLMATRQLQQAAAIGARLRR